MWSRHGKTCSVVQPAGYLVKRWVRGRAAQIRCLFWPYSGLSMTLFYLKIGLDMGRIFAKSSIFDECFLKFTCRLSKIMHSNLHVKKEMIGLKKGPSKNKWFRYIGCNFASSPVRVWFNYRVVTEASGRTSVISNLQFEYPPPPPRAFSLSKVERVIVQQ